MKGLLLASFLFLSFQLSFAQLFLEDSVLLGGGNINQSFYSLSQGEMANVSNTDWDICIWLNAFSASIRTNGGSGVELYKLAQDDTSQWLSVDTTGMYTLYNSDTNWDIGSFNQLATGHPNYGWGSYEGLGTLVGNRIYVIKLTDGSLKKIWVKKLLGGVEYKFLTADLDNSGEVSFSLKKSDFPGKSFAYYSIVSSIARDIEPAATSWDIVFRKYYAEVAPSTFYPVVGALTNIDVEALEVAGVDISEASDAGLEYTDNISILGWDWKQFNNTTFSYDISDSLSYFVKNIVGDIYHVVFTHYGGSADGKIIFSSKKLDNVGIHDISDVNISKLHIYPNPSVDKVNIVLHAETTSNYSALVLDVNGKTIKEFNLVLNAGLNNIAFPTNDISKGTYLVQLRSSSGKISNVRFAKI